MNRRRFILGTASLLAAPAIVRASSLMPVKPLPLMLNGVPIYPDKWLNRGEAWTVGDPQWLVMNPADYAMLAAAG